MFIGKLTETFFKSKHCPKLTFTKETGTTIAMRYKGKTMVLCTFVGVFSEENFYLD